MTSGWVKMDAHYYQNGDYTICNNGKSVLKPFALYHGAYLIGNYSTFAIALKAFDCLEVGNEN